MLWVSILCILPALAVLHAEATPVPLKIESAWDLTDKLPESLKDFRAWSFVARNSKLYFLLSNQSGSHAVVITDPNGVIQRTVDELPNRLNAKWLDVDQHGQIYLSQADRDAEGRFDRVLRLDVTGHQIASWVFRPGYSAVTQVNGRIIGLMAGGNLRTSMSDGSLQDLAAVQMPRSAPLLAPIDSRRILVLDRISGSGQVVDIVNRSQLEFSRPTVFDGKERGLRDSERGKVPLVTDLSATTYGNVYLNVWPVQGMSGAQVVKIDATGREVGSFLCPLATFEKYKVKGHPEGWMWPLAIEIDDQNLFLYDPKGAVARYRLP